jgi:hypothetical protein
MNKWAESGCHIPGETCGARGTTSVGPIEGELAEQKSAESMRRLEAGTVDARRVDGAQQMQMVPDARGMGPWNR